MAKIRIVHTTEYTYRNPVGLLRHRLMVRPDDSHDLRLHSATLKVEPEPTGDALEARRLRQFHLLPRMAGEGSGPSASASSRRSTSRITPTASRCRSTAWTRRPRYFRSPTPQTRFPTWRASPSARCPTRTQGRRLGAPRRRPDADSTQTLKVLEAMTHAIKQEFRYGARHEEGTQTAAQTVALGTGTCRDFAVLMMEALRSFGLATRFVTGYLYDDTSGTTRGGGSTHAWCSVYLPGAGWIEYDPTKG